MFDQNSQPTDAELAATPVALLAPPKPAAYYSPEGVLFRKAMGLIERPEKWCWLYGDGNQRCSIHAIHSATECDWDMVSILVAALCKAIDTYNSPIAFGNFNDTHTHAEVMAKWAECGRANGWL